MPELFSCFVRAHSFPAVETSEGETVDPIIGRIITIDDEMVADDVTDEGWRPVMIVEEAVVVDDEGSGDSMEKEQWIQKIQNALTSSPYPAQTGAFTGFQYLLVPTE